MKSLNSRQKYKTCFTASGHEDMHPIRPLRAGVKSLSRNCATLAFFNKSPSPLIRGANRLCNRRESGAMHLQLENMGSREDCISVFARASPVSLAQDVSCLTTLYCWHIDMRHAIIC